MQNMAETLATSMPMQDDVEQTTESMILSDSLVDKPDEPKTIFLNKYQGASYMIGHKIGIHHAKNR